METLNNLYAIHLDDVTFYAFAETQSDALKLVFEREKIEHTEVDVLTVAFVCCENEIIK